jgi:hypothetical protein
MGIVDRTKPVIRGNLGDYNHATKVDSSTTIAFSGSNEGRAFLVENKSNVVIHCSAGGTIGADALVAGTLYPIGVQKVAIGGTGVIYVLR